MSVVYKWAFPRSEIETTIPMGEGDRIIHAGQDPATGNIAVWVCHQQPPGKDTPPQEVFFVGTGFEFEGRDAAFIDSVHIGRFVFHVFTRVKEIPLPTIVLTGVDKPEPLHVA